MQANVSVFNILRQVDGRLDVLASAADPRFDPNSLEIGYIMDLTVSGVSRDYLIWNISEERTLGGLILAHFDLVEDHPSLHYLQ
jgi:hypothetical protein